MLVVHRMFMGQGVEKNEEWRGGEAEGRVGEDEDKQVKEGKIFGIVFIFKILYVKYL